MAAEKSRTQRLISLQWLAVGFAINNLRANRCSVRLVTITSLLRPASSATLEDVLGKIPVGVDRHVTMSEWFKEGAEIHTMLSHAMRAKLQSLSSNRLQRHRW